MDKVTNTGQQSWPSSDLSCSSSNSFSFVFPPSTTLFDRRSSKLTSTIVSTFTAHYIHLWPTFFHPDKETPTLTSPLPTFDGRAILYPTTSHLRDYLSWRQADCHINNLYNTTFWALVQQGGMSAQAAEKALSGTYSNDKHELLFKRFGVNYNNEEEIWKKGSVIFRDMREKATVTQAENGSIVEGTPCADTTAASSPSSLTTTKSDIYENSLLPNTAIAKTSNNTHDNTKPLSKTQQEKQRKRRAKAVITISHIDIIKDTFWAEHPWILNG